MYFTLHLTIAQDYAARRVREQGGTARVIPANIVGNILWNGTPPHQEASEQAARLVRQADQRGKQLLFNDALREVVMAMGYIGIGSSENFVVYDPQHIQT